MNSRLGPAPALEPCPEWEATNGPMSDYSATRSTARGRSREKPSWRARSSLSLSAVVSSSVYTSVITHEASTRVSKSHARVASAIQLLQSAHPRSSHVSPSGCSLRGPTRRLNGGRNGGGSYVGSRSTVWITWSCGTRIYVVWSRMILKCRGQARNELMMRKSLESP